MIHADDGDMNDIVLTDDLPNNSRPASSLIPDIDDDVTNENVINQEQSELNSNASDFADTALQEEHDDFGNLFEEVETPILSDGDITSPAKLIELQCSDRSLDKLFSLAQIGHTNNDVSYFAIKNDVLVRHSRDRVVPVGLEVTQIVVPKQLHLRMLTVAHEYPTSGHLGVKKTLDRLTRHFYWVDFGNLFDEVKTPMLSNGDIASRAKLIELQRSDRSLDKLFSLEQIGHTNNDVSYFAIKNDVLVRHSRDRVVPVGLEVTQIVVPKQLHLRMLTVAHEYPTSGHLGVKNTLDRLTRHFYWVGVGKAVRAFCRSCDVCQHLGKGASPQMAPLVNLPVIGSIFSKIAVDIVGPLTPCTGSGNRFILTVIDFASHFPLAFPLKTHTAAEVVRCLISVFTLFGFPDEILSDCGSEFMSELTQLFLLECKVE